MLKKYIQSFMAVKYMPMMIIPTIVILIMTFVHSSENANLITMAVGAMAIFLFVTTIFYYREKFLISKQLKTVKNPLDYDNAVLLGQTFLLDRRFLTYYRGNVIEGVYADISKVRAEVNAKGRTELFVKLGKGAEVKLPCASAAQAGRTAAFLQRKNDKIELINVEPVGKGTLNAIYNAAEPVKEEK